MSQISKLHSYVNGEVGDATHVQEEFLQLINAVNALDVVSTKVKLDAEDTAAYLASKLLAGTNITIAEETVDGVRTIKISASGTVSYDHDSLNNLDVANQHPITAITGLEEALAEGPGDDSITGDMLKDLCVATAKLIDLCVTTSKLANGAVTDVKLGAKSVTLAKLANDVVAFLASLAPKNYWGTSATPPSAIGKPNGTQYIQYV